MSTAKLLQGSWSARWGNWHVSLVSNGDRWDAKVFRWPPCSTLAERVEIDNWDGFRSSEEAVTWACDVMKNDGARVMVLGSLKPITLASMLSFKPAPQIVA